MHKYNQTYKKQSLGILQLIFIQLEPCFDVYPDYVLCTMYNYQSMICKYITQYVSVCM